MPVALIVGGAVSAPTNSVAPAVTGTMTVGQTLTTTDGTWTGTPTFTYQWYQSPSTAIGGATNSTYVLQSSDLSLAIFCRVTGTNAGGNASADSNTTLFVNGTNAANFLARTSGLNAAHSNAYSVLINGLDTDVLFTKLDALYVFAAADSTTALLNLISSSFNATLISTPTFAADTGFTGNGTSQALDSAFNATTAPSPKFTQNSATIFFWSNTSAQAVGGCIGTTANHTQISNRFTDNNFYGWVNVSSGVTGAANADGKGLYAVDRTASNAYALYKNGASVGTSSTVSTTPDNATIKMLGTTAAFFAGQGMAAGIGQSLGSTGQANLYARIHTYLQTIAGIA